jgi:hypothetical protein
VEISSQIVSPPYIMCAGSLLLAKRERDRAGELDEWVDITPRARPHSGTKRFPYAVLRSMGSISILVRREALQTRHVPTVLFLLAMVAGAEF